MKRLEQGGSDAQLPQLASALNESVTTLAQQLVNMQARNF